MVTNDWNRYWRDLDWWYNLVPNRTMKEVFGRIESTIGEEFDEVEKELEFAQDDARDLKDDVEQLNVVIEQLKEKVETLTKQLQSSSIDGVW